MFEYLCASVVFDDVPLCAGKGLRFVLGPMVSSTGGFSDVKTVQSMILVLMQNIVYEITKPLVSQIKTYKIQEN